MRDAAMEEILGLLKVLSYHFRRFCRDLLYSAAGFQRVTVNVGLRLDFQCGALHCTAEEDSIFNMNAAHATAPICSM